MTQHSTMEKSVDFIKDKIYSVASKQETAVHQQRKLTQLFDE